MSCVKCHISPDMQKDNYFTPTWFEPKIYYPKKWVNYGESNSRQNSVKGQKESNSVKQKTKSNINFQNVSKNATQKNGLILIMLNTGCHI